MNFIYNASIAAFTAFMAGYTSDSLTPVAFAFCAGAFTVFAAELYNNEEDHT